ncbi:MAG TPA: hypothetical protein VIW67_21990 [Terriglobales bacterium]|jgi:hypothetical protein
MKRHDKVFGATAFLLVFTMWLPSQTITLENIAARGRLHDNVYTNNLLGVEVQLPPSTFQKLNTGTTEVRAILLDETNKVDDVKQQYNFSILVRLPTTEAATAEQLVSMLERNSKSQGYESLRSGVPVEIEGQHFLQLDVMTKTANETFYKSFLVTLRNAVWFLGWGSV